MTTSSPTLSATSSGASRRSTLSQWSSKPLIQPLSPELHPLFGATVILASRIASKADGGKILVADTVRGLCSGKGFLFADQGEFVARGFEEPVPVL